MTSACIAFLDFSSMTGPMLVPSSTPRATFRAANLAVNFWANSSATDSWIKKRLAAVQASPMLRSFACIAPSTALSTSASSKTKNGALPPSSMEVRSTWSAESLISILPIGVEPVKDSLRRRESLMIGPVTSDTREVWMTFTTPAGTPTSCSTFANSKEVSGVRAAGLRIEVQPAAIAGPIFLVAMASGKFHGVIKSAGPTGFFRTIKRFLPSGAVW